MSDGSIPEVAAWFWPHVTIEGACWVWTGARNGDYGRIPRAFGRWETAHRAAFVLFHGSVPRGRHVRHTCGRKGCVNPAHLALATPKARIPRDKLTDADRVAIRAAASEGVSGAELARRYGVSPATISRTVNP